MIRRVFSQGFAVSMPACDYKPAPYNGIPFEKVVADRKSYVPTFNFHYYQEPLLMVEGKMQYLFDHKGNRYQDWISGISTVSIGHSHPALVAAITEQSKKLVHVSQINLSNVQAKYANMLCEALGDGFDTVYLCNSGSEANDFAINLARNFTRKMPFLSLRNGYHGLVGAASSVTNMPNWANNALRGPGHEKLAWPSKYRGIHQTVDALKRDAMEVINSNCSGKVAGILFEPIQGIGGINTFVDGYIPMITDLVRSHGGLIIADEVQTGFGRVGSKFWGHRYYGYKPDIVTMAKGIANGLPLAAVATRKEIAATMNYNFFNTTGGGNIQCRAAIEVLKAIKNDKLAENCEKVGGYLLRELQRIGKSSKVLGDARGAGLMIGIEIVSNKETKEPSKDLTTEILEKCRERWMLLGRGGAAGNVLRLQPSLCMTQPDAEYFIANFEDILKGYN